jgi:hypothetical protein
MREVHPCPDPSSDDLASRQLPQFDFIITSPPYWNMLRTSRGGVNSPHKQRAQAGLDTHYSEQERDLGNIEDYEEFIAALGSDFDQCQQLLMGHVPGVRRRPGLLDGRNIYDPDRMRRLGFTYRGMGRGYNPK